jgi:hypothetical protein
LLDSNLSLLNKIGNKYVKKDKNIIIYVSRKKKEKLQTIEQFKKSIRNKTKTQEGDKKGKKQVI